MNTTNPQLKNNQKGFALAITIVAMMAITVFAMTIISLMAFEYKKGSSVENQFNERAYVDMVAGEYLRTNDDAGFDIDTFIDVNKKENYKITIAENTQTTFTITYTSNEKVLLTIVHEGSSIYTFKYS